MSRLVQVAAASAVLVMLAAAPALALACASRCVEHTARSAPSAGCHEPAAGDTLRVTASTPDACQAHDRDAEAATRAQPREQLDLASAQLDSPTLVDHLRAGRRTAAVTPGAPRPGPSRPPLVLRV